MGSRVAPVSELLCPRDVSHSAARHRHRVWPRFVVFESVPTFTVSFSEFLAWIRLSLPALRSSFSFGAGMPLTVLSQPLSPCAVRAQSTLAARRQRDRAGDWDGSGAAGHELIAPAYQGAVTCAWLLETPLPSQQLWEVGIVSNPPPHSLDEEPEAGSG